MTTNHKPFAGRLAPIIGTVAVLVTTSGCGAVVQDVFEDGFCAHQETEVRRVTVTPRSLTIAAGDSATVNADVMDRHGNEGLCLPLVSWTSTDSAVAIVRGISFLESTRAVLFNRGLHTSRRRLKVTTIACVSP